MLINALIEYSQRKDLISLERGRMMLKYDKDQIAELVNAGGHSFLIQGRFIKKLADKIEISTMDEVARAIESQKGRKNVEMNPKVFELVKKELGDFEIIL